VEQGDCGGEGEKGALCSRIRPTVDRPMLGGPPDLALPASPS
jgi:hypothetical protein